VSCKKNSKQWFQFLEQQKGKKSEPASTKFFSQSSALRTSNATATMSIHWNIAIENPNGKYKESKHSFQSDYLRNKTCIVHNTKTDWNSTTLIIRKRNLALWFSLQNSKKKKIKILCAKHRDTIEYKNGFIHIIYSLRP